MNQRKYQIFTSSSKETSDPQLFSSLAELQEEESAINKGKKIPAELLTNSFFYI